MEIHQAYTDWAATYDSDHNRTRDLDQMATREILANVNCQSILELGCGTGKNTEFLTGIGKQVHALDFSAGMIEKAKAKIANANVTFELANITQHWPCADSSYDLIVCNLVLEHIEDLSFVFAEAFRVLTRPGRFFVCELHPYRQYQGTVARFERTETTEITAFVHHLTDFINAAIANGLTLSSLKEWWHEEDFGKPPRLVSFLFDKVE